jgi:S1-C subfamily serine protease
MFRDVTSMKNDRIIFGSALMVIVVAFMIAGGYAISSMREEYSAGISRLAEELSALEKEHDSILAQKQAQIDALSREIAEKGDLLDMTIEVYDNRFESLEQTDAAFGEQFELIELTSKVYEAQIGKLNQELGDLQVESESFTPIIADVIDSVVSVITDAGQGSGAIITDEGHVITNYHVLQGATRAGVMTDDGTTYSVSLLGYDRVNDIAVLKIRSNETFDYLRFGNSDLVQAGQKVVALGNPAGLSFTATEGIISSPSRIAGDGLAYLQTDVTLNPGNSGGPLINTQGRIIGIVNFKVSGYEGLGFAIPSNRAEDIVDSII